jgi:hypothetical protein
MSHYGGGGGDRYGDKSGQRGGFDSMPQNFGAARGALGSGLRTINWDLSRLPKFEKNFYIEHPGTYKSAQIM